jgi:hypothetical protein
VAHGAFMPEFHAREPPIQSIFPQANSGTLAGESTHDRRPTAGEAGGSRHHSRRKPACMQRVKPARMCDGLFVLPQQVYQLAPDHRCVCVCVCVCVCMCVCERENACGTNGLAHTSRRHQGASTGGATSSHVTSAPLAVGGTSIGRCNASSKRAFSNTQQQARTQRHTTAPVATSCDTAAPGSRTPSNACRQVSLSACLTRRLMYILDTPCDTV